MLKRKVAAKSGPSRRERGKADKMRRILAAGDKLFSQQGFDKTTVQQIADEADVGAGTLFLYVSDKSELLLKVFHSEIEVELRQAIIRLKAGKKFVAAIRRFLLNLMGPYEKDRELSRVFFREFLFHKGKVRAELDQQASQILQALQEAIKAAQADGQIDARVDSSAGALQIYGIFHATLAFHLADCLQGSPKLTLESLLHSAWLGMAPRE
jgi:AcrR family transcriptional regulator